MANGARSAAIVGGSAHQEPIPRSLPLTRDDTNRAPSFSPLASTLYPRTSTGAFNLTPTNSQNTHVAAVMIAAARGNHTASAARAP